MRSPRPLSRTRPGPAFALALAAAVSLGLARLNAPRVLTAGGPATAAVLAAHAFAGSDAPLSASRTLAGVASAAIFVGGGLLAARLAARSPRPGLVPGTCYGGAGLGILLAAALVPPLPWREAGIMFALGRIVGPSLSGRLDDDPAGCSAASSSRPSCWRWRRSPARASDR